MEVWHKEGARNSKFFHASTISKRKRNLLIALKDDQGMWMQTREEIGNYLVSKFEELYQVEEQSFCDCLEDFIQRDISAEENTIMDRIHSDEEIINIVKSMHPIKASGPDGMPAIFFQRY